MKAYLFKNAFIVNEGQVFVSDLLIKEGRIAKIATNISVDFACEEINAEGKYIFPGCIDDQVHFREPGLTHKADIYSESRAAVAGGVTSFMEMPNTSPQTLTQELLEEKYALGAQKSAANYSFFMGASNENLEELKKTNPANVCGIKIFMGASTGNMLVDNTATLEGIFSQCPNLIAIHSENESIIRHNLEVYKEKYGEDIPMSAHPEIRNVEACYSSTERAVALAKKHGTRLHILHISTEEELAFFENTTPLEKKKITAEACVHHLWFSAEDYAQLGGLIKCNPAIKEPRHKTAVLNAVLDDRIDIIATDHAPHTWDEKQQKYLQCPSGLPLVQHPLLMMLEFYHQGKISLAHIAEKMAHDVAICFKIKERGYLREGYKADIVLVDLNKETTVTKANILYKCGWSPLENYSFKSSILQTYINGAKAWDNGMILESHGERLTFQV
ncbi:MAG: dihydroorotase [Bacteroidetes bacterium]|nr:dihydroorotase [Bacteroidota bacterium]